VCVIIFLLLQKIETQMSSASTPQNTDTTAPTAPAAPQYVSINKKNRKFSLQNLDQKHAVVLLIFGQLMKKT